MIWTGLPSGSRNVANRANPPTSPMCSSNRRAPPSRSQRAASRSSTRKTAVPLRRCGLVLGAVQREADRPRVELGPRVAVAAHRRQAHDVAVERDRRVHVADPVVDVVEVADGHAAGTRRSARPEDLRLLRLELLLGEHALGAEVGEALELGRTRRDGRGPAARPAAAEHPRVWLSVSPCW